MPESKKRDVIDVIFKRLRAIYPKSDILKFDNEEVKGVSGTSFVNQFDATKYDTSKLLPDILKKEGFFIVHLGKGNHAFVRGDGYHKFEKIRTIKEWGSSKSIIDNISQSEAQSASTAFNDKIIHDFLFEDKNKHINLHTARRAKISYDFVIDGKPLRTDKLQIEIDGIYESQEDKTIAVIEVKNQEHEDFEIRQLFSSMRYFEKYKGWKIPRDYQVRLLFMVRKKDDKEDQFKLYEYDFIDKMNPNSIKLLKAIQYDIISESAQTLLIL